MCHKIRQAMCWSARIKEQMVQKISKRDSCIRTRDTKSKADKSLWSLFWVLWIKCARTLVLKSGHWAIMASVLFQCSVSVAKLFYMITSKNTIKILGRDIPEALTSASQTPIQTDNGTTAEPMMSQNPQDVTSLGRNEWHFKNSQETKKSTGMIICFKASLSV